MFIPYILRMLQDIQERIIFLVQTFIRDEIYTYIPNINDLNYPDNLVKDG